MKNSLATIFSILALATWLLPANVANAKQSSQKIVPVIVKIILTPAPGIAAKASAKLKIKAAEQEFEVEAQLSRKLAGTTLGVTVGDQVVGTMTVNALGKAKLNLNSELGQTVPTITTGTLIGVVNANGNILLAGQF